MRIKLHSRVPYCQVKQVFYIFSSTFFLLLLCTLRPCYPFPVCKQLYNMNSMMGRVLLLIWKRPNFTRWNKGSFKFKSIQAQYGLTTGLHTRAESFYAQQRHTALGKEVHFIFLNLVIFFHWQYTIKYQEYWMLCFKYSPDCRAMNYLLLLVQKTYLTGF